MSAADGDPQVQPHLVTTDVPLTPPQPKIEPPKLTSLRVSWNPGSHWDTTVVELYPLTTRDRALLAWAKLPWWRRMITARPTPRLARFARR